MDAQRASGLHQGFQSTLPVWGATEPGPAVEPVCVYFNPRSPCGERHEDTRKGIQTEDFNPRSPCGERQQPSHPGKLLHQFQSTLPVWGATPVFPLPRGVGSSFQSTLPVWGATFDPTVDNGQPVNFNPRSPCGERPARKQLELTRPDISIHAPRVGSDQHGPLQPGRCQDFNPRSPCGERLSRLVILAGINIISIHAPRVGSDFSALCLRPPPGYFNPRSPCGERLMRHSYRPP